MRKSIQTIVIILSLLFANSVNAQTLFGVYKSDDGKQAYATINGDLLTVIDDMVPGIFFFSGYNANGAFYSDQFLGTVFVTLDTKKIVINSIPKQTSVSYNFIRVESIPNGTNIPSNSSAGNFSSPNQNSTKRKCGFCDGAGACPYCNSAGQSKGCVQNQFGVTCSDTYCIAKNHRCKDCLGTHVCSNCKGTGYK